MANLDFSKVRGLTTPRGEVIQIARKDENNKNVILWNRDSYWYISFGDSIAAGHAINDNWDKDYGTRSQYGGGSSNPSTVIVPGTYTDLIRSELKADPDKRDEKRTVTARSYARSGDINADLMDKLYDPVVVKAVKEADIVTICIGANTILGQVGDVLGQFITEGAPALNVLQSICDESFIVLEREFPDDSLNSKETAKTTNAYGSYNGIFKRLTKINTKPTTKFVFTTVYNPYKYLWLDEPSYSGNFANGYFGKVLELVPNITFENLLHGENIFNLREFIYNYRIGDLISLKEITERIDDPTGTGSYSLAQWVESQLIKLNGVISKSIADFGDDRFLLADTKSLFDTIPDRHILNDAGTDYSDLVNVEIVKGQDLSSLNWKDTFKGKAWYSWLEKLNYNTIKDGSFFSLETLKDFAVAMITDIITFVLVPNIDPHPEEEGQKMMFHSFSNALDWEPLTTTKYKVTLKANGGVGNDIIKDAICLSKDGTTTYLNLGTCPFIHPTEGYRFIGWKDEKGTWYSNGETIKVDDNITLYAQWSDQYIIRYNHIKSTGIIIDNITSTYDTILKTEVNESGHTDCYELYLDGIKMPDRGAFSKGEVVYSVPYGTKVKVAVNSFIPSVDLDIHYINDLLNNTIGQIYEHANARVYFNGSQAAASGGSGKFATYEFTVNKDLSIDFHWKTDGTWGGILSEGDKAKSWEDCYITTFDASYQALKKQPYTISYDANGGKLDNNENLQESQDVLEFNGRNSLLFPKAHALSHPRVSSGYRFIGWKDDSNNWYSNRQMLNISNNLTLLAQWSDQRIIKFKHSNHTNRLIGELISGVNVPWTGHNECYSLYINGVEITDLDALGFNTSTTSFQEIYSVPYNSYIVVNVRDYHGEWPYEGLYTDARCDVYFDGVQQSPADGSSYQDFWYGFSLKSDVEIDFRWKIAGSLLGAFNGGEKAKSFEDCYITTFDASHQSVQNTYSITYASNGNSGSMETQTVLSMSGSKKVVPKLSSFSSSSGQRFAGWKERNSNTRYYNGQPIELSSNIELVAQWVDLITVSYYKTAQVNAATAGIYPDLTQMGGPLDGNLPKCEFIFPDGLTAKMCNNGIEKLDLSMKYTKEERQYSTILGFEYLEGATATTEPPTTIDIPKNTKLRFNLENAANQDNDFEHGVCGIYRNGTLIKMGNAITNYEYPDVITNNITINFKWGTSGNAALTQDAHSWWDVYVNS